MTITAVAIGQRDSLGLVRWVLDVFRRGVRLDMAILVLQRGFIQWLRRVIPATRLISYWAGREPHSWPQTSGGTTQQP